jgi:hypothetical protein
MKKTGTNYVLSNIGDIQTIGRVTLNKELALTGSEISSNELPADGMMIETSQDRYRLVHEACSVTLICVEADCHCLAILLWLAMKE